MESFNGKYYTTNNESYTDEHNKIMDNLLWAYFTGGYVNNKNDIDYNDYNDSYYPLNEDGADLLEHLLSCDLISVVAD